MAQYGIMRIEKRGRHAVGGLQKEAVRDEKDIGTNFDRSEIDWSRTAQNIRLRDCREWNSEITREIHAAGAKERKDSIVMLDGLYTASPEWFETHPKSEWLKYFEDCLAYHDKTYGQAFSAVIHLDEATPHMQVASVPLIKDHKGWHLSAKLIMGGRIDYRHRQEDFWQTVAKFRGLERGEIRDPAETKKHIATQKYKVARNDDLLSEQGKTIARNRHRLDRQQQQHDAAEKIIDQAEALKPIVQALDAALDSTVIAQNARKSLFGDDLKISPSNLETLALRASMGEQMQSRIAMAAEQAEATRRERREIARDRTVAEDNRREAERIKNGAEYREQSEKVRNVINQYNDVAKDYNRLISYRESLEKDVTDLQSEKSALTENIDRLRHERYMRRFCRKHQKEYEDFVQKERLWEQEWER